MTYGEPYSANLLSASLNIPTGNTPVDLGVRLTPGKTVQLWLSTTTSDNLLSSAPLRIIEGTVSFDVLAADTSLAVHAFELGLATPSGAGHSSIRMVRGLNPLKLVEVRYLQAEKGDRGLQGIPGTPAPAGTPAVVTTLDIPQMESGQVAWTIIPAHQGDANVGQVAPGNWAQILEFSGHTVPKAQIELNMGMTVLPAQSFAEGHRHWVEVGIFKRTQPTSTDPFHVAPPVDTLVKRLTYHYTHELARVTVPFVIAGTIYYGDIRASDTLVLKGRALVSGRLPAALVPDATLTPNTLTLIPDVSGVPGPTGAMAPFWAVAYRAVAVAAAAPRAPSGGQYSASSHDYAPPTGWSTSTTYNPQTHTLWRTQVWVVPSTYDATVGLGQWQTPIQAVLKGASGTAGKDAPVYAYIYRAVTTGAMAPEVPTGGTYNTSTQVVVPPEHWSLQRTYDPATQTLYGTQILINPNTYISSSDLGQWQMPVVVLARGPAGPKGDPGDAGSSAAGTPTIHDWSATGTYVQNEVVRHNGRAFIAKRATVTQGTRLAPSGGAADADWAVFDAQDIGVWSGTEAYVAGTVRLYTTANGRTNLYQATQDVAAGTATAPAANPAADHRKWRLVNDGDPVPRSVAYVRTAVRDSEVVLFAHAATYNNVLFKGTVIDEAEVGMSYSTYRVSHQSQKRFTFTNLSTTQDQTVELNGKIPIWYRGFAGTVDVIWEEYLATNHLEASRTWVLRTVGIAERSEQVVTSNLTIGPSRVAVRHGRAYRIMIRWTRSRTTTDQGTALIDSVGVKHTLADDTDLLSVTLANPNTTPDASQHVAGTSYARHEVVERDGIRYYSLTDNNISTPGTPPTASFPWRLTVAANNGDPPGSGLNPTAEYGAFIRHFGSFLTGSVDGHTLVRFHSRGNNMYLNFDGPLDFDQVTWDDSGTLRTLNVADARVRIFSNYRIPSPELIWVRQQWFTNRHIGTTQSGHFVRVRAGSWATVPSEFDQNGLEIVPGASLPDLGTHIGQTRYRAGSVINVVGTGLFSARKYQGARNVVVATMHGAVPRTVQGQSVNSLFRAIHTNTLGEGALDNEYGIVGVAIQKQLQGTSDTWSVYILARHSGTIDGSVNRKVTITGGKLANPVTLTLAPTTVAFHAADNGLVIQYKTTTFTTAQTRELAKVAESDQLTWTLTSVQDNPVNFIPELAWGPLEVEGWVQEMTRLPPQKRLEYQVRAGLPDITADTPVVAGAFARLNGKLVEGKAGRAAIASTQRNHVHLSLFQTHTAPDTRVYDASHGSKSGDTLGLITRLDFTRAALREGTTNEYTTSAMITLSVSASLLGAPHFTQTPGAFKLVYTDAAGTTRTFLLVDTYRVTLDGSRVYQFLAGSAATGHSDVDFQLPTGVIEFQLFYGTGGAGTNTAANTTTKVLLNEAAGQTAVAARWVPREGLYPDYTYNLLAGTYEATNTELQAAPYNAFIAYQTGRTLAGAKGVQMAWEGLANYSSHSSVLTMTNYSSRIVREFHFHDVELTDTRPIFIAEGSLPWDNSNSVRSFEIALRLTDMLILQLPSKQSTKTGKLIAMYPLY